jgi:hypothetical protein
MFRDVHACTCGDESASRRDVERPGSIASRTARIQNCRRLAIPERQSLLAHDTREADQFLSRFAFHPKSGQETADLRIRRFASHDDSHGLAGFLLSEIDSVDHLLDEIANHAVRKFFRIFLPTIVMIDSQ